MTVLAIVLAIFVVNAHASLYGHDLVDGDFLESTDMDIGTFLAALHSLKDRPKSGRSSGGFLPKTILSDSGSSLLSTGSLLASSMRSGDGAITGVFIVIAVILVAGAIA